MTATTKPTCETCRWFLRQPGLIVGEQKGECHVRSPQIAVLPTPRGVQIMGVWPATKHGNWCGEHEAGTAVES